jgi:ABC-type enterobactin transport system permease subunit
VSSKNYTHYDTIEFADINNDKCADILLHRGQVNLNDSAMPTRILLNDCKGNFNEISYPKNLPVGILTVIGDGNYAILISQKNGNTYTQRVDHVRYDWTTGKSLFN